MTNQAPQRPSSAVWLPTRRANAASMAVAKASMRATIDKRARSIFQACVISSSQSSGPAKPSTARTGANSSKPRAVDRPRRKSPPRVLLIQLTYGRCRLRFAVRWSCVEAQPWPSLGQCCQGAPRGPIGRPERDMDGILSSRLYGPAPHLLTGDDILGATCRSGRVVPQCSQSQASATGSSGPSRRISSGTGMSACRSNGHAWIAPTRATAHSWRRPTASRVCPASTRAPATLSVRG
jgi:hypothetical protein